MQRSALDVVSGSARWAVLHGDARLVLHGADFGAGWWARVADHVITDPPYDAKTHASARTSKGSAEGKIDDGIAIDFDPIDPSNVAPMLLGVAKRWTLAFCALEQLGAYAAAAGPAWVRAGLYVRTNGSPQFTGDRPAQAAEGIAIMHRPGEKKRWNGKGSRGLWSSNVVKRGVHPTEKPIDLMMALVEAFTDADDLVIDPYCGSGTTGLACLRLGRRFVGIEIDAKHAETARAKLAAEDSGSDLWSVRAGQRTIFDLLKKEEA